MMIKVVFTCTGTLWESIGIGSSSEHFGEMPRFSSSIIAGVKDFPREVSINIPWLGIFP